MNTRKQGSQFDEGHIWAALVDSIRGGIVTSPKGFDGLQVSMGALRSGVFTRQEIRRIVELMEKGDGIDTETSLVVGSGNKIFSCIPGGFVAIGKGIVLSSISRPNLLTAFKNFINYEPLDNGITHLGIGELHQIRSGFMFMALNVSSSDSIKKFPSSDWLDIFDSGIRVCDLSMGYRSSRFNTSFLVDKDMTVMLIKLHEAVTDILDHEDLKKENYDLGSYSSHKSVLPVENLRLSVTDHQSIISDAGRQLWISHDMANLAAGRLMIGGRKETVVFKGFLERALNEIK